MKIMTYNLASGIGTDHVFDWKRSAQQIRQANPDVVGCEEVTQYESYAPHFNMSESYAEYLGMNVLFGRAAAREPNSNYGIMMLSKYPMTLVDILQLPNRAGQEQRICMIARIESKPSFYFVLTHFPYAEEYPEASENRRKAICLINDTLKTRNLFPAVLCGDFNAPYGTSDLALLRESWDICNDAAPGTPTHDSGEMLDYICCAPKGRIAVCEFQIGELTAASDHCPVSALLEVGPGNY